MVLLPGGNVGIGTFTEFPTITDKLQVFGDIRVGTTGTDGCIKRFDGGLIAQDVEQVLPELVVTNDDGFKAVDYSELPLLTIQAVKDLKAENDALRQRVADLEKSDPDALKQRVSELERLVTELLAAAPRR